MQVYNLVRPREDKNGQTSWDRVGILLFKDDGSITVKLDAIPTNWDGWLRAYPKEESNTASAEKTGGQYGYYK
jgi:hypothetical protein